MNTWWSEDELRTLRHGDVMPLPLMVETNWTSDGWEVNVALVTQVVPGGYNSVDVWTHREPYAGTQGTSAEADRVTDDAITAFGLRLRAVLADD